MHKTAIGSKHCMTFLFINGHQGCVEKCQRVGPSNCCIPHSYHISVSLLSVGIKNFPLINKCPDGNLSHTLVTDTSTSSALRLLASVWIIKHLHLLNATVCHL